MDVRLLGEFAVTVGGRAVEISSAKQRAVLATLALEPNAVISTDRLIEAAWGEDPPATALATVRGLVSRLRKVCSEGEERVVTTRIRSSGSGYVLDIDRDRVDVHRFERLVVDGRTRLACGDPATASELLHEAAALWRGPALGDMGPALSLASVARRLDDARLDLIEDLAEAELALGRSAEALTRLERHVETDPLRERPWAMLMTALYRLGRQSEALGAYQRVRSILSDELGLEPNPVLRDLEARILRQDETLMERHGTDVRSGSGSRSRQPAQRSPRLSGIAVFLFTDIEASTRRWEGDQEGMAANLARHDKLLIEACEAYDGKVFSHTGDGIGAAFSSATGALRAAAEGQRALLAEVWGAPLRVRMAVHAGAAENRGGNYFGPALNRTARLLGSAWGGQVVCSQAAADLASDDLPDDIALLDRGELRLADLARPERVYQLTGDGLPVDFPPLRAAHSVRTNLPAATSSFVGRAAELEALDDLLPGSRLVTLIGLGGTGKTRLALEVARRHAERYPDGAWLVELAPVRDPAMVSSEVAAAVGLDLATLAGSGRPFDDALCDLLQHRRMLLLVDNCEHVIQTVARLVHRLLVRCPDLTIVATSREVLGVAGEMLSPVGPLSLPVASITDEPGLGGSEAIALFCERARESAPGFALTPSNSPAVLRICCRLEGLPLALELAAARMRLLGANELAERIDQGFRVLAGGSRTADPRHQTLESAFEWSYALLSEEERSALARLSVFRGTFDLPAAEAVVGGTRGSTGPETLDLLSQLADKSLLVSARDEQGRVRHRMLEPVRQFAAGKLGEAGETADARHSHRDHFLAQSGRWRDNGFGGRQLQWAEAEQDNLRAALEWSREQRDEAAVLRLATPQWLYWLFAGSMDGREWLERAVAAPCDQDVALGVQARLGLAMLRTLTGRPDTDDADIDCGAVALATRHGDANDMAFAAFGYAELAGIAGHMDERERLLPQAAAALGAAGDPVAECHAMHALAWSAVARGDLTGALARLEGAHVRIRQHPDNAMVLPHVLIGLAFVRALLGAADAAEQLARAGVDAARACPGRTVLVMSLLRAAQVAVLGERSEPAREHLDELLGVQRELGSARFVAEALELTASLLVNERPGAAATVLGGALSVRAAMGEQQGQGLLAERMTACQRILLESLDAETRETHQRAGVAMHRTELLAFARAQMRELSIPRR